MAEDAKIQQFTAITGADVNSARFFLESNSWNVQRSVNAFLGSNESGPAALQEDNIPPPQPQVTERLFQPARPSRRQLASDSAWSSNSRLARIFKVPENLYSGSFEQAADLAASKGNWLLVNIQDMKEFKCHELNRDIWGNEVMQDVIRKNFVFWQQDSESEPGRWFSGFYNASEFPFVVIVHPKSRQIVKHWPHMDIEIPTTELFVRDIQSFLESKDVSIPAAKRRKIAGKQSTAPSEDEAIRQAIQNSLKEIDELEHKSTQLNRKAEIPGRSNIGSQTENRSTNSTPAKSIPEPSPGKNVTTLQLRFPSEFGLRPLRRRFLKDAPIKNVFDVAWQCMRATGVDSLSCENRESMTLRTTFPRRKIQSEKSTIEESKLLNAVVVVELA